MKNILLYESFISQVKKTVNNIRGNSAENILIDIIDAIEKNEIRDFSYDLDVDDGYDQKDEYFFDMGNDFVKVIDIDQVGSEILVNGEMIAKSRRESSVFGAKCNEITNLCIKKSWETREK
jgi:hypothetical protein